MTGTCGPTLGFLLAIGTLGASPPGLANAIDRADPRILELQEDVRSVRSQIERAPRTSSLDLKELQRRLHDLRIDAPPDPRLQDLETELRRLRAKAERYADHPELGTLPRTSPLAVPAPMPKPRYLEGAHTPPAAMPARPYFGQRLVALQRSVTAIEARLEQGDTTAAARLLEAAQGDLATLRRVFERAVADDPNLIALENRIRALEAQLAPR